MSDIAGTEGLEPEVPAFEPPPPPEPVAAEEAPSEQELILGKFKSQDDLVRSYQELERQFHSRQPEPEPEPDPTSYLPPHVDEQTWNRAATWAGKEPGNAAVWAMQNPHVLGQDLTQALVDNWAQASPSQYMQFLVQTQYEQPSGPSPGDLYAQEQQVSHALNTSATSLPEFDRYKDAIAARIDQNQHYYGPMLDQNPAAMTEVVKQVYAQIRGEEWLQNLAAQVPQDAQVDSKKTNARTLTRSTAASQGDESDEDKFAALIAGARGI